MSNAWDNLPNARQIDRVLAHLKENHDKWDAAWDAARAAARAAARGDARAAARAAAWGAAWDAARDAAWDAAWDAARDTARGACAALIVWDDVGFLLDRPVEEVRALAVMGSHAAILLLPAVIAMNGEK